MHLGNLFLNPSHNLLKFPLMLSHHRHDCGLLGNSLLLLGFHLILNLLEEIGIFRDDLKKLLDLLVAHSRGFQFRPEEFF